MPTCADCGRDDFRSESGLRRHRAAKHPPMVEGVVLAEVDRAVKAADHLTDMDLGTVAVLRDLAKTIDGMPLRDAEAPLDNVTIPTFLKYADALGLTPLSRLKFTKGEERSGSKLAHLRAVRGKAG